MRHRDLHRYCQRQVKTLEREVGIPDPFVLDVFLDRFAGWRGRRIELLPYDHIPGGMYGMWLGFADFDLIAYAEATPLHAEHIVLHEVGHMLCGHRGGSDAGDDLIRVLLPSLDPGVIRAVLGRTSYSEVEEQEAELIATMILSGVADKRPREQSVSTAELTPELNRLFSTFEG